MTRDEVMDYANRAFREKEPMGRVDTFDAERGTYGLRFWCGNSMLRVHPGKTRIDAGITTEWIDQIVGRICKTVRGA